MIRFDLMEFYKHRFYKHMDLYFVLFLYYHYRLPGTIRERFYHSRSRRPIFQGAGDNQTSQPKNLQTGLEQIIVQYNERYNVYRRKKERVKELQTVKRNIDQILRREEPHRRKEQSHER